MPKLKIISSYDLECLRSRINEDIIAAHRMIEQLDKELTQHLSLQSQEKIINQKNTWQTRIQCYRSDLSNISFYTREIEI